MSLCARAKVTDLTRNPPHSNQGEAWGVSRPADFLSQPQDSQGEVKVFDYELPPHSKWRAWEEKFVCWLSGWETDVSLWTVKGTKAAGIEEELFYKEFARSFPHHTDQTQILFALRVAYGR